MKIQPQPMKETQHNTTQTTRNMNKKHIASVTLSNKNNFFLYFLTNFDLLLFLFQWKPFSPLLFLLSSTPKLPFQSLFFPFLTYPDQLSQFAVASENSIPRLKNNLFQYPKVGFLMSSKD